MTSLRKEISNENLYGAGASIEAISAHYDEGNEFFSIWLDERRIYSAARFNDPCTGRPISDDLDTAQLNKLDFHLNAAGVSDGARILDIGCGWGGLLIRAQERFNGIDAVGLTLSGEQRDFIRSVNSRIDVHLTSWENFTPKERFDAIISIGAMEHFCVPGLTSSQKINRYRKFFRQCRSLLNPKKRLSLQTICWDITPHDPRKWLPENIFPESDVPRQSEVLEAAASENFELQYLECGRDDYRRTCEIWLERIRANSNLMNSGRSSHKNYVFYERYMRRSIAGFRRRHMTLLRFIFLAPSINPKD